MIYKLFITFIFTLTFSISYSDIEERENRRIFQYTGVGFTCELKLYKGLNTTIFFPENSLVKGVILTATKDFSLVKVKNKIEISPLKSHVEDVLVVYGASGRSYHITLKSAKTREKHDKQAFIIKGFLRDDVTINKSKSITYVDLMKAMVNEIPQQGIRVRNVYNKKGKPISFYSRTWPGFLFVVKKEYQTSKFVGNVYDVYNVSNKENVFDPKRSPSKGIELVFIDKFKFSPKGNSGSKGKFYDVKSQVLKSKKDIEQEINKILEEDSKRQEEEKKRNSFIKEHKKGKGR